MTRKVCVVITARPSYSRVRTALEAIRDHPDLELQLVVAASALLDRYGGAIKVIESDGFKVDRTVYMIVEGENLVTSAKSTGFGLAELATVFDDLKPDMVITIADRYETIATSIAAAYMNIPLVHLQGGEVTGSIDEKTRHANTKLADVHLVCCESAHKRVQLLGERPERIFLTGCPSIDLARQALEADPADISAIVGRYAGVGPGIDVTQPYVVVMQHPVTTEHDQSRAQAEALIDAVEAADKPTLWFWPNVDAGSDGTSKALRVAREHGKLRRTHFYRNMQPLDFLKVLIGSRGIIGNSSVALRECAYLGVPAVNIGTRQQGRDRGRNVVDVGYGSDDIAAAIERMWTLSERPRDFIYGDGFAGRRIAEVLATADLSIEKMLTYSW
ncbi:UDP-hydrolyzing UDP-N-acetyl-D-glucosamine 2-epimerase [Methylopila capsulata]|uniref:UDP-N-acetyl glucosamine 2-epimerase n=1 Tax=Methylopila capsulata TaxID=61654 RepID=A0A9W6IYA6_9HYPH|nr:UDP-N-acetylglucosamine 2-epimerase [Methylopila capsulata]MBM7853435.1 UDP-hydrolyzing UDP-N-acetyl-D-glucosamine 2-epimerase [Methylopila capsulata]GLK57351.1 UDP-N-acetyl glucosamine 2-epimerase [Methylopila capsulata]